MGYNRIMKKVLLRAPLLTNSGYGIHSRQLFSWLYERKDVDLTVECLQWGRTSWILDENQENGIFKKIMKGCLIFHWFLIQV